ncbi:nuclease A inhibitor family protein [Spirosoma sp. BT702]|uniref:Nuclease A inhibitor family protein n=1 Tax=Spirosoma profusum TaxID=2771354 RepID=A0A927AQF4_9BACT|nr:nuclease A inhibitor family protein [Spirosoma profusum]MBD2700286.1 nuclease A inhibitor family protein [Spirosoma profusum]
MTNEEPKSFDSVADNSDKLNTLSFADKINPLLSNLLYPSESDEPVETVTCYLKQEEPLTVSQIKDWQMFPPEIYVEEIAEADFWEPVIIDQEWYGDEEKARTEKFQQLKQALETDLSVRQVFRVGDSEIEVYLLGRLIDGTRAGIKTKVIET